MKKHTKLLTLLCTGLLFLATATPAFANNPADEVGVATTLYQEYLKNGATHQIKVDTDVVGRSPMAENFINQALGLVTRLVPFSLDANMEYYSDADPTTFFVTFRGREYNDQNRDVQKIAAEIVSGAAIYDNDYDRLRYLNNYIVDHCQYLAAAVKQPKNYPTAFTTYGCLVKGQAVCEGYANSMQLLCELLEIPCIKVTGTAYGGNHIWNAVYLNNKWWMLDVTFNDPVGRQDNADRWSYFLLDVETFQKRGTHTYSKEKYELSKQIYTGRTVGQTSVTLPFSGLSLQNAVTGEKPDPDYLTDIGQVETIPATSTASELTTSEKTSNKPTMQMNTQTKAEALKARGLFAGDEGGFRLEDNMTRVEMGVMVMRMNGGLNALREKGDYYTSICPFTDVPKWAKSSIGFLYDSKLVAGQSANTFGAGNVTKRDYAVMMMRLLGIEHSYEDALAIAVTHGILTEAQASGSKIATRGDIVNMTYATLQLMEEQQQMQAA